MPQVKRVDLVHRAICSGVCGQIEWKPACLERFRNDHAMKGFTEKGIKDLIRKYVQTGQTPIKPVKETALEWLAENPLDPWWYSIVVPVAEFPRGLFVKMKLLWEDGDSEDDAWVQIVSIHEEREGKIL